MFLFCRVSWLYYFKLCLQTIFSSIVFLTPTACVNSHLVFELFADWDMAEAVTDSMGHKGGLLLSECLLTPTLCRVASSMYHQF